MPRLIDADRFWKDIALAPGEWAKGRTIKGYLDSAPTIDAEPVVHSSWCDAWPYRTGAICRKCETHAARKHKYCPECGAKMDAKDNDVPTKPEAHRPEDCVNYATRTRDGRAVCLGTRELEPCDGAGCKRWKGKANILYTVIEGDD